MESKDEDKLIVNGEMFYSVRTYMRQKKPSAEIIAKIEELLNEGADINACDGNDNNNTILHIAIQKEEKNVVMYLLQKGANLFTERDKQTAMQLALQTKTVVGKEIAEIFSTSGVSPADNANNTSTNRKIETKHSNQNNVINTVTDQEHIYLKRKGTSGVSGQFYETKLLSLVLHRALHDKDINDFYLAANIKDIGDFDDVCFRYDNVVCFMQTKHRENTDKAKLTVASVRSSTGKLGLGIYFDSFLRIRQKFSPIATDPMFHGKFDDVDCHFVIYTPLKESFERKLSGNKHMCNKLHDVIFTGEKEANDKDKSTDIFQFDFEDRDLIYLTNFIKHEHMKILAKTFLDFIISNNKLEAIMTSDLIKIYHPALAQKVILISKILKPLENTKNSNSQSTLRASNKSDIPSFKYVGRFRPEFFDSEESYLITLKDTFYKEIVFTHSAKTALRNEEMRHKVQDIASNPCAETISHLIGCPIQFDETTDKLSLDTNKLPKNMFRHDECQQINLTLQKIQVTKTMVKDAVYLAGKRKLCTLSFPLPQSFGNTDLTTNQKTFEGMQSRLDFLADKFRKLIDHYSEKNKNKVTKITSINSDVVGPKKILEHTHLNANGGIGGAVGNLLRFDIQNECFTFNTKDLLPENAKYTLEKIKELTGEDLTNYKIYVHIDNFPRFSFDVYEYDKNIAKLFLSKLWFFTNQAQEEAVESTIKKEINIHYNADKERNQFLFHVHSDAIFLRFHDEIQKWWKRQKNAQYLTKTTTIFEKAKKDIVDSPLLTVLNIMFLRKIKTLGIEFNMDAIDNLNLDDFLKTDNNKTLNIISDAVVLSAAKIMQYNKYRNQYTFINLDYIHILPPHDYKTMIEELEVIKDITLVIVSETPLSEGLQKTLLNILYAFNKDLKTLNKQIIIITGEPLLIYKEQLFQNYDFVTFKDDSVNFRDLTSQSRSLFLNTCEVIYQGQNVKLDTIIDENSEDLISAKLLWSLLNKEKMEIGQTLETHKYNEIKNYYINRNLKYKGEHCTVNTLNDIDDKTVLISSQPCMGKTILLTHLSLETKKVYPKLWIVRINLSPYDKHLEKIKQQNIDNIIAFLSKAALKNQDETNNVNFTAIDDEIVAFNSDHSESLSFELQLFIRFYNTGNIIFLFDGFDKIYPQNTNEGIELFTALQQANKRIWITADCYVIKFLEVKFGTPYELQRLSTIQQKSFLERFWTTNLRLEKLNHEQFNNITTFLNYILRIFNCELNVSEGVKDRPIMPLLSVPLHILYLSMLDYFKEEANSLSFCYFRDKIKSNWSLDSFTSLDRYFGTCQEDESLQLTGTPLHLYVAANYFVFQITDKFDLHLDTNMIIDRSNVYINAIFLYERFLKSNIKTICEIEDKTDIGPDQEQLRNNFFDTHKKLALYAIYKECDIVDILTSSDIREVKKTISLIESGEMKTGLIDSVVDGVPQFYHALFAEYFIVEFIADLMLRVKNNDFTDINLASLWNFLINAVLVSGPASLRNAFEYKLKYNPELAESLTDVGSKNIIFDLLLKPSSSRRNNSIDTDNALNVAINEGLVNIINLLLKNIQPNDDNASRVMTIIQSSANILVAVNPSQSILSDNILKCIQNPNGETILQILNSNDSGVNIQNTIKEKFIDPVKKLTEEVIKCSGDNENLVMLANEFKHHLPDCIRAMFPEK